MTKTNAWFLTILLLCFPGTGHADVSQEEAPIVIAIYEGEALSSVTTAGQDKEVGAVTVDIADDVKPTAFFVSSFNPVIWQFTGNVDAVQRLIVGSYELNDYSKTASGVTGIAEGKISFLGANNMWEVYDLDELDAEDLQLLTPRDASGSQRFVDVGGGSNLQSLKDKIISLKAKIAGETAGKSHDGDSAQEMQDEPQYTEESEDLGAGVFANLQEKLDFLEKAYAQIKSRKDSKSGSLKAQISENLGRPVQNISAVYETDKVRVSSKEIDFHKADYSPDAMEQPPHGFERGAWQEFKRHYPAGVIFIDPTKVAASSAAEPYQILPGEAGLAQLAFQKKITIEKNDSSGKRVYRIIDSFPRFPAGMPADAFVLADGVMMPAGHKGNACIYAERTSETLAGNKEFCTSMAPMPKVVSEPAEPSCTGIWCYLGQ